MSMARHTASMPSHAVMRMPVVRFIAVIGTDWQSISVEIARQEQFGWKPYRRSAVIGTKVRFSPTDLNRSKADTITCRWWAFRVVMRETGNSRLCCLPRSSSESARYQIQGGCLGLACNCCNPYGTPLRPDNSRIDRLPTVFFRSTSHETPYHRPHPGRGRPGRIPGLLSGWLGPGHQWQYRN